MILSGVPCDFRMDYGAHIPRKATYIAINRSLRELTKNRMPQIGAHADPHDFLLALAEAAPAAACPERAPWMATLAERDAARNAEISAMAREDLGGMLNPMRVCQSLDRHLPEESVLVADGGDFVATASYIVSPRGPLSWLDPGVFGTLGVGAGFALGAKLVRPEAEVFIIWGDGSAGYSLTEFDTFTRHKIPVIGLVGNDACWTQIARDQIPTLGDDVACMLAHSRYDRVAAGWGGLGIRVEREEELDPAFERALEATRAGQPALIDAVIGKTAFREGSISI